MVDGDICRSCSEVGLLTIFSFIFSKADVDFVLRGRPMGERGGGKGQKE